MAYHLFEVTECVLSDPVDYIELKDGLGTVFVVTILSYYLLAMSDISSEAYAML